MIVINVMIERYSFIRVGYYTIREVIFLITFTGLWLIRLLILKNIMNDKIIKIK